MGTFLIRALLFVMGLIFAASLAVAVLVLAAVWAVQAGWAKLTGRPVSPWVARFNPRSGFERYRQATQPAQPTAADQTNARARGESARSPVASKVDAAGDEVTDVPSRPVRKEPVD